MGKSTAMDRHMQRGIRVPRLVQTRSLLSIDARLLADKGIRRVKGFQTSVCHSSRRIAKSLIEFRP